jgi:hypothetical protein
MVYANENRVFIVVVVVVVISYVYAFCHFVTTMLESLRFLGQIR